MKYISLVKKGYRIRIRYLKSLFFISKNQITHENNQMDAVAFTSSGPDYRFSWYFFTMPTLNITPTPNAQTTDFKVTGLPHHTTTNKNAGYSIFLNPGDGRYLIAETGPNNPGQLSMLLPYTYHLPTSSSAYTTYAEATELYDGKEPPTSPFRVPTSSGSIAIRN